MTMATDKQDKVLNFSSEREQSGACSSSAEREKNQGKNFLNVPTLRFPEFKDDWNDYHLRDLCTFHSGGTPSIDNVEYWEGEIPFVSAVAMHNTHIEKTPLTLTEKGLRDGSKQLEAGNLLLLVRGSMLWNKIPICYNDVDVAFNQDVKGIVPNSKTTSLFLLNWIQSHENRIKYMVTGTGIGAGKLDSEDLLALNVKLPSLIEQKKIEKFLSLIDERIETQIRIIEDLKSLSDVICERLYTPSEKDSWQTYKYADLFSISNERNGKLQYSNVLSASQEYGMIERNELNIDIKFEASSIKNYKIVRPNQYVIHLRSFQGGFAYSEKTGVCSPAYTILVPNEKISPAFLKYYFTSKKFIDSLRIVTYGIRDGRSISVEEFLQLKVAIPDIARQQQIVQVMQLWEEKIRTEEEYLSKLQQQKKYLLSSMFI